MKKCLLVSLAGVICVILLICNNKIKGNADEQQNIPTGVNDNIGASVSPDENKDIDVTVAPNENQNIGDAYTIDSSDGKDQAVLPNLDDVMFYVSDDGSTDFWYVSTMRLKLCNAIHMDYIYANATAVEPDALYGWSIVAGGYEGCENSCDFDLLREKYSTVDKKEMLKNMGLIVYDDSHVIASYNQIRSLFAADNGEKAYEGFYYTVCPAPRNYFE